MKRIFGSSNEPTHPDHIPESQDAKGVPMAKAQSAPPTLLLTYDSWTGRHGRIADETSGATLYEFDSRLLKPHMTFRRSGASKEDNIGVVVFPTFSRGIEMQVHGTSFQIKSKNWKSRDYQWTSPAFGGQTMTWHVDKALSRSSIVLLGDDQLPVAKLSWGGWSLKTTGKSEFMGDRPVSPEALDELVITGAAMMTRLIQQNTAAASGAAGGGGA